MSGILPRSRSRDRVAHYCRSESAIHLDDVMVRRTGWRDDEDDAADLAQRVAEWMGEILGWDQGNATRNSNDWVARPERAWRVL